MEQCYLNQLHLRPVRIHYVSPQSKTIDRDRGPWITHVDPDASLSLVRFYHPDLSHRTHAVLADEFQVAYMDCLAGTPIYLRGFLRSGTLKGATVICLMPYSDEELAEAILFRTQIAYLIEDVKSFWQDISYHIDGVPVTQKEYEAAWKRAKLRR